MNPQSEAPVITKESLFRTVAAGVCIAVIMAIVLRFNGRIWWCKMGDWAIYVNEAWNSSHTSQHFFDPYSLTHVLHGVLGFWLAGLLLKNYNKTVWVIVTLAVEAAWEILENSNFIIEKYRENTASLDYFGDSIANSIGDLIACAAGFLIALKLGVWRSLVFFVIVELLLLVWIRDGFLLNILMLIYPLDSIKAWQMGS
jgi:Protein of unknown function (DUF2585)